MGHKGRHLPRWRCLADQPPEDQDRHRPARPASPRADRGGPSCLPRPGPLRLPVLRRRALMARCHSHPAGAARERTLGMDSRAGHSRSEPQPEPWVASHLHHARGGCRDRQAKKQRDHRPQHRRGCKRRLLCAQRRGTEEDHRLLSALRSQTEAARGGRRAQGWRRRGGMTRSDPSRRCVIGSGRSRAMTERAPSIGRQSLQLAPSPAPWISRRSRFDPFWW